VIVLAGPGRLRVLGFVEARGRLVRARGAVVVFDLPLCGSRQRQAHRARADSRLPLARRAELEAQVASDLAQVGAGAADPSSTPRG
jgi:hypothetical protein